MAHILFVTYGITSYLNATYAVAAGLRERGHLVTYVSSLDVSTAVTAQGFAFTLLAEEHRRRQNPERLRLERLSARQRYRERAALIRVGQQQRDYYLKSGEWTDLLQRLQPDLLLIDEELPETIIRAANGSVPILLVQYLVGTRWQRGLPPANSHLIPGGGLTIRTKIAAQWLALWLKRGLTHFLAPLYYAGTDRRSIIRALAVQHGFDYRRAAFHHWFPMIFPELPTLFLTAPEFDFEPDIELDGKYAGPMVWRERADAIEAVTKAALDAFLARNAEQKRPLIYCSLGTFWQMNVDFLRRVITAVGAQPEWDLVLATGPGTAVDAFAPVPENVLLVERAPQLQVLAQADLVLTHGGIGTINECITYGVPLIVYSTGQVDQNGNAARVAHHGLGLRGDIAVTPTVIEAQIARVLAEPHFRASVERMQAVYRRYQDENRAVALIEELL